MPWYVVNKEGKVIVKCWYEPSEEDLKSRGEIAIYSEENILFEEAMYKDGKIIRYIPPTEEIEKIKIEQKKHEQIKQSILNKFKALGFTDEEISALKI